jgi:hypothetical protein
MTSRYRIALISIAAALGAVALFLAALHPVTGAIGGLIFLLAGWALPSLVVIGLAVGLAIALPLPSIIRAFVAATLSILLGLNTSLAHLPAALTYKTQTSSDIRKSVTWDGSKYDEVDVKRRPWGALFVDPLTPRVSVGGDEGCGCMYFIDAPQSLYNERVISLLFKTVGRAGAVTRYSEHPASDEGKDVHIDLTLWHEKHSYRALIEVFDRGEKIAAFAQTGLPEHALVEPNGVGRGRIAENFWPNAFDILMHGNVFAYGVNELLPKYFPETAMADFFATVFGQLPKRQH